MNKVLIRQLGADKELWASIPFFVLSESDDYLMLDNGAGDPQLRVRFLLTKQDGGFTHESSGSWFEVERLNPVETPVETPPEGAQPKGKGEDDLEMILRQGQNHRSGILPQAYRSKSPQPYEILQNPQAEEE